MCEGEIKRKNRAATTDFQVMLLKELLWMSPHPKQGANRPEGSRSCKKRKAEVPATQHIEGAPSEAWTTQSCFPGPLPSGALKENGASTRADGMRPLGEPVMKAA